MRVIRGLTNTDPFRNGCVATIGNFDGVHLGHQHVIRQLAAKGQQLGLPVVVVLFEPQPLEYFRGRKAPSRLTRFREKINQIRQLPVDHVLLMRFNQQFSRLSADEFIREILLDSLRVRFLLIGDDFRFGRNRAGDFSLLHKASAEAGFELEAMDSFMSSGQRVSSTGIRNALAAGDMPLAAGLLGRPYSVCGRVIHGDKKGRTVGFPTANIPMCRKNSPVSGVFAVTMQGITDSPLPGVANIGSRPTVDDSSRILLETHLFDFQGDLYGKLVEVQLLAKIRDERRFDSFDALKQQIERDAGQARTFLRQAYPALLQSDLSEQQN